MQNFFRWLQFQYLYFRNPPWDTGVTPPELLEFIENHKPGRAIDIGCGTGTNIVTLVKAGWKVTGIDFAPRAIKLAKERIKQAGVQAELLVKDATKLEGIQGPFDFAFDLGCFHTIPPNEKPKYLNELNRILAQNGFWLMYGFIQQDPIRASHGLVEADIRAIASQLTMVSRREGFDDHRARSSAWFLFQKPNQTPT